MSRRADVQYVANILQGGCCILLELCIENGSKKKNLVKTKSFLNRFSMPVQHFSMHKQCHLKGLIDSEHPFKHNKTLGNSVIPTSLKHGEGLRICSSMAHLTEACRMLPSYSRELWVPLGVPRERSYPGSLK